MQEPSLPLVKEGNERDLKPLVFKSSAPTPPSAPSMRIFFAMVKKRIDQIQSRILNWFDFDIETEPLPEPGMDSVIYLARNTIWRLANNDLRDVAAALTYFTVLSIFPGLLALVSIVILTGQAEVLVPALTGILEDLLPVEVAVYLGQLITIFLNTRGAGIVLVIAVATAVWTASQYVAAFTRVMNRILDVDETRPFPLRKAWQLLLTLSLLLGVVAMLALMVFSRPVVDWIAGLFDVYFSFWDGLHLLRVPFMLLIGVSLLALLYYLTPDIDRKRFRFLSIGAIVAVLAISAINWGFGIFLQYFSNANLTYGALGTVITALLWLWMVNLAIIGGAELDAEVAALRFSRIDAATANVEGEDAVEDE